MHDFGHALGLMCAVKSAQRMHMHGVVSRLPVIGLRRHIRHRAAGEVFGIGHHRRERAIHPIDHAALRTEIDRQREWRQRHATNALVPRAQIQPHFGFAKAIDRLHRIAHHKQRAPVICLPTGGELLQQFELRQRGVLEFIHQQMMDAIVQRQRQIRRRIVFAQRAQSGLRHCGEISLTAFAENQFQFRRRQRQQGGKRFDHAPLCVGVRGGRQRAREMQRFH